MDRYHYIFFDVDNTLSDNATNSIPASLTDALKLLEDAGCRLSIATGRGYNGIPSYLKNCWHWFSYVTDNGPTVYDENGNCLRMLCIPEDTAQKVLALAEETGSTIEYKTPETIYRYNEITPAYMTTCEFFNVEPWLLKRDWRSEKILTMIVSRDRGSSYEDFENLEGIDVAVSPHCYADINLAGMTKYEGIRFCSEYFGFEDFTAFGDAENDLPMLVNAKISVAMGNADRKIKDLCTMTTDTAGKDGIYKAALRLLEIYK